MHATTNLSNLLSPVVTSGPSDPKLVAMLSGQVAYMWRVFKRTTSENIVVANMQKRALAHQASRIIDALKDLYPERRVEDSVWQAGPAQFVNVMKNGLV